MRISRVSGRTGAECRRLIVIVAVAISCLGAYSDDIVRGDLAWERRAEGETRGVPVSGPILESVQSYERALADRPKSLEAHWKLLRALYFAGYFPAQESQQKRSLYDRGREVSDSGLQLLAEQLGSAEILEDLDPDRIRSALEPTDISHSDVARLFFWSAINWGAWSREVGLLSAVYQGVANRLYQYTVITIALEPDYFEGGAFRLLGRLHAELPRVPFVSGWVDREKSIPLVERAYAIAPADPGNQLLLALTLLDLAPERRDEGLDLLKQVERLTPRPSMHIEDLAIRREARERLAEATVSAG